MYFEGGYRLIGKIDPEPFVGAVESSGDDAWFEYPERQQTFHPHRNTQAIPLLYDQDERHSNPTEWPRWAALKPVFEPVLEQIRQRTRLRLTRPTTHISSASSSLA